jgi:hypothetical protein
MNTLSIGSAAGFSGDRTDAALPVVDTLIRRGGPAALIFETLAERTLALAQLARRNNPDTGYEPLLADMITPILGKCLEHHIPIVSNFGAANPLGAAKLIRRIAEEQGLPSPRIAVVSGDVVSDQQGRALLRAQLGVRERVHRRGSDCRRVARRRTGRRLRSCGGPGAGARACAGAFQLEYAGLGPDSACHDGRPFAGDRR